jgi:predicted deacylase
MGCRPGHESKLPCHWKVIMLFEVHTIRGRADGPHLLITAGVHGDEWEPMIAVRRLAATLESQQLRGRLTLVPNLNVPAYRAGDRVGEDGLDLARTCPGRDGGSPTEQIAFDFSRLLEDADYYIDLHTGGVRLTIWPLAGYFVHRDETVLERQRLMARAFGLSAIWGTDPTLQGRTLSVARDKSIPAIYVEYLGSGAYCPDAVAALEKGCRQVMAALDMAPHEITAPALRYFAEDLRPGAGHLQASHQSPADGIFEPSVNPGDPVEIGTAVGYLTRDGDGRRVPISAEDAGRIVAIRSLPRVLAGEALAVVAAFEEVR